MTGTILAGSAETIATYPGPLAFAVTVDLAGGILQDIPDDDARECIPMEVVRVEFQSKVVLEKDRQEMPDAAACERLITILNIALSCGFEQWESEL